MIDTPIDGPPSYNGSLDSELRENGMASTVVRRSASTRRKGNLQDGNLVSATDSMNPKLVEGRTSLFQGIGIATLPRISVAVLVASYARRQASEGACQCLVDRHDDGGKLEFGRQPNANTMLGGTIVMATSIRMRCLLLACASSLGLIVGVAISMAALAGSDVAAEIRNSSREFTLPNTELSPDEVVRLQTGALREFRHDRMALLQCFCLASPANRIVTGPLNRFGAMVRQPQYEALVFADCAVVGRPVVRDSQAVVLVTVVDANRRASVFRFILSKQQGEPFDGCWMTDAVTPDVSSIPSHSHEPLAARELPSA